MYKVTIDPGKTGAMATLDENGSVATYKCPETMHEVYMLLGTIPQGAMCIIEKVHAMPGQGVVSTWKFSENYTTWRMGMICLAIPFIEVTPQRWMKALGNLPKEKSERKNEIKSQMQKRYPGIKVTLANADALAMLTVFDQVWR